MPAPLALLPAHFDIIVAASNETKQEAAIARGDMLTKYHPGLVVKKKDATSLVWKDPPPEPLEMTLDIAAFGDFNHDGLEDVLLYQTAYSYSGSYRVYRHLIVTREKEKGPLVVVGIYL